MLLAGCFEGGDQEMQMGCGPNWMLTLTEGPARDGSGVVTADSSSLMRFPLWFIRMADQLATRPPEEAAMWAEMGYRVPAPGVTEFHLTNLEWSMVVAVLDEAAVNEGAASIGPVDDYGSYRFQVADGLRMFQYDFVVMMC